MKRKVVEIYTSASSVCLLIVVVALATTSRADDVRSLMSDYCTDCHDEVSREGGLDLRSLEFSLDKPSIRQRWIHVYDRVEKREMPPSAEDLDDDQRRSLLGLLRDAITKADRQDVIANGRGPMRRLTREEYEQNLRDVLKLPLLDIRGHAA